MHTEEKEGERGTEKKPLLNNNNYYNYIIVTCVHIINILLN